MRDCAQRLLKSICTLPATDSHDCSLNVQQNIDIDPFENHFGSMNVTLEEFPPDLHSRLKNMAEDNGRSLNRQIIHLLDMAASPRVADDAALLHRIKLNRQRSNAAIGQVFLTEAIQEGRS